MRILAIADAASVHARARTEPLLAKGHEVTWISERRGSLPTSHLHVVEGATVWARLRHHRRLIRSKDAEVIHAHYAASLGAWLVASSGRSTPVVVTVMGGDVLDREQMPLPVLARWMTRQVLRRADLITAKSQFLADAAVSMGAAPDRVMILPWGVDLNLFHRRPAQELRHRLGLADGDRVIFSPRALKPFYAVHVLVEAMAVILQAEPRAYLVLSEHDADPEYREELKQRIEARGIARYVIWAGDIRPEDMADFYSLAEVMVSIPPSDGFPQSVLEAQACGTPCVVTDLPRLKELLTPGESAVMTAVSPQAVAESVLSILTDEAFSQRLIDGGAAVVERVGDLDAALYRLDQAYDQLVRRGGSGPLSPLRRWAVFAILAVWAVRAGMRATFQMGRS